VRRRLAVFVLAASLLALAGLAAREALAGSPADPASHAASPIWRRLKQVPLTAPWNVGSVRRSAAQQKALEDALARAINDVRQSRGLRPFATSSRLATAAAEHTREMGADGYFEHDSYDTTPFWKRIQRWYPSKGWTSWSVGENLLYSSPDVTAGNGITMWMNSPPHRANVLSRTWREVGISAIHFAAAPGEYDGQPVTIVTADFGARR
jgi:uncharacterized protein YkwD